MCWKEAVMTRRSRTDEITRKTNYKVWKIAIYIRLSKEDARCFDESESVTNQRNLIQEHISGFHDDDEYIIVDEYVDDGISGTTDDGREDFQRMLADIKRGLINCVIVKDLARSFRNYSDQGYYLDDLFPRLNVRFISLFHQPLDSYKKPQDMRNIAVPIQGVLNENHCAETSDKVREVFDMKRRSGKHIGSFAVYGYLKNPNDNNALIIDEEAAQVIRNIYDMFLDGMSKNSIVHFLNDHGILSPSTYKKQVLGLNYQNPNINPAKPSLWTAITITGILKNRMYCGDMVQGRYRTKSYKIHVQEQVSEDEWYIVENTHEAIIDRETFKKVQHMLKRNTRTSPKQNKTYLFSGFLRCGDCGKAMSRSEVKGNIYYYCRTYKDQSKSACTKHAIKHNCLEAAVLFSIQQQIYLSVDYNKAIEQLNRVLPVKNRLNKLSECITQKEQKLSKIECYKQYIYQDWKDNEISHSDYLHMKEDYTRQANVLQEVISRLQAELTKLANDSDTENLFLSGFRQYQNIKKLSRDVLIELVDHIEIYEDRNIHIVFRFADELDHI